MQAPLFHAGAPLPPICTLSELIAPTCTLPPFALSSTLSPKPCGPPYMLALIARPTCCPLSQSMLIKISTTMRLRGTRNKFMMAERHS